MSAGLLLTIPRCIAGSSTWCRYWIRRFAGINVPWDAAGAWTKPISKSEASGNICTAPSTAWGIPSISCLPPDGGAAAALRFFRKAIRHHGEPEVVTIDKSGTNTVALVTLNADKSAEESITIRQNKYLNNLVEQDHCNTKRRIRQMQGFKSFRRAQPLLAGIELIHMTRKGQYQHSHSGRLSPAERFYLLAA